MNLEELLEIRHKLRIRRLIKRGLKLGVNCYVDPSATIDGSFPWLISIGDNCRITANVVILAHDASTKALLGYTKIGVVTIGSNCFIGAGAIILPNVHIGNNVVIGAGSIVTKDIRDGSIAVGVPARVVKTTKNFADSHLVRLQEGPCYPKEGWTDGNGITKENKRIMWKSVKDKIGYVE